MSQQRKILRNMFREEAKKRGSKPSEVLHRTWEIYQVRKLNKNKKQKDRVGKADTSPGAYLRARNVCRGTHKRSTWPMRYGIDNGTR